MFGERLGDSLGVIFVGRGYCGVAMGREEPPQPSKYIVNLKSAMYSKWKISVFGQLKVTATSPGVDESKRQRKEQSSSKAVPESAQVETPRAPDIDFQSNNNRTDSKQNYKSQRYVWVKVQVRAWLVVLSFI